MSKINCNCGKMAVWLYMPSSSVDRSSPYYCDDCVPRGCECQHEYIENSETADNFPTEEDKPYKWIIPDKAWTKLDEKGREYPCVEYDYEEEGFDEEEYGFNKEKYLQ